MVTPRDPPRAARRRAGAGKAGGPGGRRRGRPSPAAHAPFRLDVRVARLADLLDVGLLFLDRNLGLEFASHRAREILGTDGLADGCGPLLERALGPAWFEAPEGSTGDAVVSGERGPVRLGLQLLPLSEDACDGYIVLVRDRDVVRSIERDLRAASRLRSLSDVLLAATHDLRAPLNAMVLNLHLLDRSLTAEAPRDELTGRRVQLLRTVEEEIGRLRRALDWLLAETAPAREERERVAIADLAAEIAALLGPQARRESVTVDIQPADAVLEIEGQRDWIKQALLNVAINALEAMPGGGRLRLSWEREEEEAVLRVSDTGPGIPADVVRRIFDMHFTTKSSGTGIGLYVAHTVLDANGGSLRVLRTGPEGTTFEIRLPLFKEG